MQNIVLELNDGTLFAGDEEFVGEECEKLVNSSAKPLVKSIRPTRQTTTSVGQEHRMSTRTTTRTRIRIR